MGKLPSAPTDITNKLATTTALSSGPVSTQGVISQIASVIASTYATKVAVDQLTATFTSTAYVQTKDALNIPLTAEGIPGGVATLNSSGIVPSTQFPPGGAGYILGAYGLTATYAANTGSTPAKIGDWQVGTANVAFRPQVYLSAFVTGTMAHPVIEVRMTNSATAPANYAAAGDLIGLGEGRSLFNDAVAVDVVSVPNLTGAQTTLYPTSYQVWATAWLYDANNAGVNLVNGQIANAALYLVRGTQ